MGDELKDKSSIWDQEIFGIKLKYLITVLSVPILINCLVWIPDPLARGDYNSWIGFFGNYSGGIVGAFVALLIAKSQTKIALMQINEEKRIKKDEQESNEKAFAHIVEIFLFDEIKRNLARIYPSSFKAIQSKAFGDLKVTTIMDFKNRFEYQIFNDLKYEIPKHYTLQTIKAISFYRALRYLENYEKVNEMPKELAEYICDTVMYWEEKFESDRFYESSLS